MACNIIIFVYSHAKFSAYKIYHFALLVRDCDLLYANMLRIYRDWIPLHLLRERSNITSLNNVAGNGDISNVDRGWDHSYIFSDHFPRQVRDVAAGNGHSLLWPKATTFLSHIGAYSRSETATVACGPKGTMFDKATSFEESLTCPSLPPPGQIANRMYYVTICPGDSLDLWLIKHCDLWPQAIVVAYGRK